jgi:hypothetical protein
VSDDDSSRTPYVGIDNAWAVLAGQGYILTSDQKIGLPSNLRQCILDAHFNDPDGGMRHDAGDWPVDRLRARDVIRYHWRDDGGLDLQEYDDTSLTDRAGIPGKRDHARVMFLNEPWERQLVRTLLHLVPPDRRQADGTFGVNLFRTFTNVVTKAHRDDEQFVILYALDRVGEGAVSYLYEAGCDFANGKPIAEPVLQHQLNQGDILIFDDERFIHDVSPLDAAPDGTTQRDMLVCTVDYWSSYLGKAAESERSESILAGSRGGRTAVR